MLSTEFPRPVVTVATLVMRGGSFLCVEEETSAGLKLNQPAGHLEPGESLVDAAIRETLEESAYHVAPTALVGIYRWQRAGMGSTYVRFAFAATALSHDGSRPLDRGIVRAEWLDYDTLRARRTDHRSPLVLRCVEDYLAGTRMPLAMVSDVA